MTSYSPCNSMMTLPDDARTPEWFYVLISFMYYTSKEVYEFISKQTNDPIVEWKTCAISGQPFAIYQSDLDFYAKISPTFA